MDEIDLRAGQNHGVMQRDELLGNGVSERVIDHALATGRLIRCHEGIYRHALTTPTRLTELMAAQAWAGTGSFFSHRTGAELFGLDGVPTRITEICTPIGLATPGVKVHRIAPEDRPPIRHVEGLRVAHIERTLLDLAATVPYASLGECIDDALRKRLTTLDRLGQALVKYGRRGKNGTRAFRVMIEVRDTRDATLASRFEAKMLRILRRIGHPAHEPQHRVLAPEGTFYLDFAFPSIMLGIECHSIRWHLGEAAFKRDLRRDRILKLLGWTMLYFSWDDVHLAPKQVETEIHQAIANLLPHLHLM